MLKIHRNLVYFIDLLKKTNAGKKGYPGLLIYVVELRGES